MSESERLARQVVRRWRAYVDADLERDPPGEAERALNIYKQRDPHCWRTLYGSTLIAAARTDDVGGYLQIGDGDLLRINVDGAVVTPLPNRKDLAINQTDSLCQTDAINHVRLKIQTFSSGAAPTLVLLSSDGYANSFNDEQAFLQVGTDLLDYVDQHGLDWVAARTEGWS